MFNTKLPSYIIDIIILNMEYVVKVDGCFGKSFSQKVCLKVAIINHHKLTLSIDVV